MAFLDSPQVCDASHLVDAFLAGIEIEGGHPFLFEFGLGSGSKNWNFCSGGGNYVSVQTARREEFV